MHYKKELCYCEECNMPTIGDWTKHETGMILCGNCYQLWKDEEPETPDLSEWHTEVHEAIEQCDQKRREVIPETKDDELWVVLDYVRTYEED